MELAIPEETLVLIDKARALKPRFRRLNSMSDIAETSLDHTFDSIESNLHRPISAPDLNKKQNKVMQYWIICT